MPAPFAGGFRGPRGPTQPGPVQREKVAVREKVERDCLKLIQAVQELKQQGEEQSLRIIAARTGMSKDEVNRYLSPTVRELYDFERLMHVRRRNRPLYNWLIVSGPPKVESGKWAGILANTSKYGLFQAVCLKFGYVARHLGRRGQIIDLEYRGIENITQERVGKVFSSQEAILAMDEFLPSPNGGDGAQNN
jgi:hypothetical protein